MGNGKWKVKLRMTSSARFPLFIFLCTNAWSCVPDGGSNAED